jgi:hypothetical protein
MSRKKEIKAQIKELKKELNSIKDNVLKVGEWYKYGDFLLINPTNTDNKLKINAYGLNHNEWFNDTSTNSSHLGNSISYVKATETEVFEALKKEAIKRGFVKGSSYKNQYKRTGVISDNCWVFNFNRNTLSQVNNVLGNNVHYIFNNGVWAEIIEDKKPTINGYEMEIKGDYISFGCKKFSIDQILGLYSDFNQHNITSFAIDNEYQVTISELEEVVNYINKKN